MRRKARNGKSLSPHFLLERRQVSEIDPAARFSPPGVGRESNPQPHGRPSRWQQVGTQDQRPCLSRQSFSIFQFLQCDAEIVDPRSADCPPNSRGRQVSDLVALSLRWCEVLLRTAGRVHSQRVLVRATLFACRHLFMGMHRVCARCLVEFTGGFAHELIWCKVDRFFVCRSRRKARGPFQRQGASIRHDVHRRVVRVPPASGLVPHVFSERERP